MPEARLERSTVLALIASLVLAVVKLLAGVFGRSSALIADAVESIADAGGSLVVLRGLRVAARPPDEDHPYGYGRAETVAALAVGVMLCVAAGLITWGAVHEIMTPHRAPAAWTLGVLVLVILVKEGLFRFLLRTAEAHGSDAVRADAWHHRADAITSAAAVVGVSIAVWGPGLFGVPQLVLADEAAALIASGIILTTAWRLARPSMRELLDATSPGIAEEAKRIAEGREGVVCVEKVYARKSGRGYHLDMHLHVDPEVSVKVAHAIAGAAKAEIKRKLPRVMDVLVHVEPAE